MVPPRPCCRLPPPAPSVLSPRSHAILKPPCPRKKAPTASTTARPSSRFLYPCATRFRASGYPFHEGHHLSAPSETHAEPGVRHRRGLCRRSADGPRGGLCVLGHFYSCHGKTRNELAFVLGRAPVVADSLGELACIDRTAGRLSRRAGVRTPARRRALWHPWT